MEQLLGGFSAGKKPDSSKDLEKDEREAMELAWGARSVKGSCSEQHHQHRSTRRQCFEAGWHAKGKHSEARLQQVEAERDRNASVIADAQRMYAKISELLAPYKLPLESIIQPSAIIPRLIERIALVEAELSIAREALKEIRKPGYFYSGAEPEALRRRAEVALARLQAKEEEPIAEQMEKWDP
jgi:hypothetical protein